MKPKVGSVKKQRIVKMEDVGHLSESGDQRETLKFE